MGKLTKSTIHLLLLRLDLRLGHWRDRDRLRHHRHPRHWWHCSRNRRHARDRGRHPHGGHHSWHHRIRERHSWHPRHTGHARHPRRTKWRHHTRHPTWPLREIQYDSLAHPSNITAHHHRHASGVQHSLLCERPSSGVNQLLCLLLHPSLVIHANILLVLPPA